MANLTSGRLPRATGIAQVDDSAFIDEGSTGMTVRLTSSLDSFHDQGLILEGPAIDGSGPTIASGITSGSGAGGFEAQTYIGAGDVSFSFITLAHGGTAETPTYLPDTTIINNLAALAYAGGNAGSVTYKIVGEATFLAAGNHSSSNAAVIYAVSTWDNAQAYAARFTVDGDGHTHVQNGFLITDDVQLVSALPAASSVPLGTRTMVSDAAAPVFAAIVVGSGGVVCPVYSDHVNWRCG